MLQPLYRWHYCYTGCSLTRIQSSLIEYYNANTHGLPFSHVHDYDQDTGLFGFEVGPHRFHNSKSQIIAPNTNLWIRDIK